jgi:hypothetical protein
MVTILEQNFNSIGHFPGRDSIPKATSEANMAFFAIMRTNLRKANFKVVLDLIVNGIGITRLKDIQFPENFESITKF